MVSEEQGQVFRGIGVSPGVATGPALLLYAEVTTVPEVTIAAADVPREMIRLEEALIETRRQILKIQEALRVQTRIQDASILDAHLMVLDDRTLIEEVVGFIREKHKSSEFAVQEGTGRYAAVLEAVKDDYLRERVADIKDVARRVLRNLAGMPQAEDSPKVAEPHLIVAHDLAPSETASLPKGKILGFATDLGSPTSHTAVMARALELPAVVGLHDISGRVKARDQVLIDGNKGVFILNPNQEQLQMYGRMDEVRRSIEAGFSDLRRKPAVTKDGREIVLSANIEGSEDINAVLHHGARGVGLLRTEFLHLSRNRLLDEEEQFQIYDDIAMRVAPDPLIIRTLDIGGDKFFTDVRSSREVNPFLGLRSIRLSLRYPDYFKQQMRAILRASVHGNVRIMYPMIGSAKEVQQANEHLMSVKQELETSGVPFDKNLEVGAMIEVPSAALTADVIARHVDFLSIGTNDLIQYTLAVDRGNERVAYLYEPTHPAVLKLIHMTVKAAHDAGIWVGLCGEMAADPLLTPLLIGLELDELSVTPRQVPLVKDAVRSLDFSQATELVRASMESLTAGEVRAKCRRLISETAPEILTLLE